MSMFLLEGMECFRFPKFNKKWATSIAASLTLFAQGQPVEASSPNVLFIAIDDLNNWIQVLDPSAPIKTPNLDRLAQRGVLFTHAYCNSPACNPSRVSLLTGKRPTTTGVYGNNTDWKATLPGEVTLPRYFKDNQYATYGAGKIFHHHSTGFHDDNAFDDFLLIPPRPSDQPMPPNLLRGVPSISNDTLDWGVWPPNEEDSVDFRTANYAIGKLQEEHDDPFFLAVGIFRPHFPYFCPQRLFDQYPEESLVTPDILENDRSDLPSGADNQSEVINVLPNILSIEQQIPGSREDAIRAYQAGATYADEQIGRVLDALDASPYADNTIIALWSDHGYHLGEKEHWTKFVLWEKALHVPLIIAAPNVGTPGTKCHHPVELVHLYPTLVDLCQLPSVSGLDGVSLKPLLENPAASWTLPALSTYNRSSHSIRTAQWRFIRYKNGTEELYDHNVDPNEWNNLASDPSYASVLQDLRQHLPASQASQGPSFSTVRPGYPGKPTSLVLNEVNP